MRLRPDQAWQRDIPPLPTLRLAEGAVYYASRAFGKSTEDMFSVGRAAAMDVLLDRFPFIHNFTRSRSRFYNKPIPTTGATWGRSSPHSPGWTAEEFLFLHLRGRNITMTAHTGFRCFIVRPVNFSRQRLRGTS